MTINSLPNPFKLYREGTLLEMYDAVADALQTAHEQEDKGVPQGTLIRDLSAWMDAAGDWYWQARVTQLETENAELKRSLNERR